MKKEIKTFVVEVNKHSSRFIQKLAFGYGFQWQSNLTDVQMVNRELLFFDLERKIIDITSDPVDDYVTLEKAVELIAESAYDFKKDEWIYCDFYNKKYFFKFEKFEDNKIYANNTIILGKYKIENNIGIDIVIDFYDIQKYTPVLKRATSDQIKDVLFAVSGQKGLPCKTFVFKKNGLDHEESHVFNLAEDELNNTSYFNYNIKLDLLSYYGSIIYWNNTWAKPQDVMLPFFGLKVHRHKSNLNEFISYTIADTILSEDSIKRFEHIIDHVNDSYSIKDLKKSLKYILEEYV